VLDWLFALLCFGEEGIMNRCTPKPTVTTTINIKPSILTPGILLLPFLGSFGQVLAEDLFRNTLLSTAVASASLRGAGEDVRLFCDGRFSTEPLLVSESIGDMACNAGSAQIGNSSYYNTARRRLKKILCCI